MPLCFSDKIPLFSKNVFKLTKYSCKKLSDAAKQRYRSII